MAGGLLATTTFEKKAAIISASSGIEELRDKQDLQPRAQIIPHFFFLDAMPGLARARGVQNPTWI